MLTLQLDGDRFRMRSHGVAQTQDGCALRNPGRRSRSSKRPASAAPAAPGDPNNDGFADLCLAGAAGGVMAMNAEGTMGAAKPSLLGDFDAACGTISTTTTTTICSCSAERVKALLNAGGALGDAVAFPFEPGKRARAAL
ncbi:MAG: hypothetical protein R2724_05420 [Bryobacterales bacterium]